MNCLKVSVDTTPEGTEILPARLLMLGIEGFEIDEEGDFLRFVEEKKPHWDFVEGALYDEKRGRARVSFYLTADEHGRALLESARESLRSLPMDVPEIDFGALDISVSEISPDTWENAWKPYYKPVEIGERLLILPAWEPRPETGRVVYINDPGHAFGTGTHATTKLLLEYAEKCIYSGCTVLDVGCGSGILSVSAVLLGARSARALDIDPGAVSAARENAERNGVSEDRFYASCENILLENATEKERKRYDIIFMNIVADVILPFLPRARTLMAEGGRLYLSGILSERRSDVEEALLPAELSLVSIREEDGWAAFELCLR